jgi:4-hydroxy-tetrahydrodipicolinate synthase
VATNLCGVWAAVPTPWDAEGRLAEGMLERNIDRYAAHGINGVYTTDSDGEFYAIELDEFRRLVAVFARAMHGAGLAAAVGVTWSHTAGIVDRIKVALDAGYRPYTWRSRPGCRSRRATSIASSTIWPRRRPKRVGSTTTTA